MYYNNSTRIAFVPLPVAIFGADKILLVSPPETTFSLKLRVFNLDPPAESVFPATSYGGEI
jgi:hypothetical protein